VEVRADGRIININHQVNFFRRFNYVDNAVSRAIFGGLANEPYVEITLREDPDEQTGLSNEYTFFLAQAQLARVGLGQNSTATVIMGSRRIADRWIWIAETIDHPW
jgi:hypothetical protein